MKILRVLGLVVAGLAALLAVAFFNRAAVLNLAARLNQPHVGPNQPVNWQAGPTDAIGASRPPNIIVILADDMGFNDITANGGGVAGGAVPTPNIDSIAHNGVTFENGYAGNATCAPSRAALMTGRYPTRFGFEFTPAPVAFERLVGTSAEPGAIIKPKFFADRATNFPP